MTFQNTIRAVLFDLYGTLTYEIKDGQSIRREAYRKLVDYLNYLSYSVDLKCFIKKFDKNVKDALNKIKGTLDELDMIYVYWKLMRSSESLDT